MTSNDSTVHVERLRYSPGSSTRALVRTSGEIELHWVAAGDIRLPEPAEVEKVFAFEDPHLPANCVFFVMHDGELIPKGRYEPAKFNPKAIVKRMAHFVFAEAFAHRFTHQPLGIAFTDAQRNLYAIRPDGTPTPPLPVALVANTEHRLVSWRVRVEEADPTLWHSVARLYVYGALCIEPEIL